MTVVIIGAGKTGRGFLGRLFAAYDWIIYFVDNDAQLVDRLSKAGTYTVRYFGGGKPLEKVSSFSAVPAHSREAVHMIAEADLVFVCAGFQNIIDVADQLASAMSYRVHNSIGAPQVIFTAENALDPAKKLESMLIEKCGLPTLRQVAVSITEAAVFCSTIEDRSSDLDLFSEDYHEIPFDISRVRSSVSRIPFLVPDPEFGLLLKRKIFTYNCASAAISYLGDLLGYDLYADAANDPLVITVLKRLYDDINKALCREYILDAEDQAEFAMRSLKKFQNRDIRDSIQRNARDAKRKLTPEERMIGPALIMNKHGICSEALSLVIAAAFRYAVEVEHSIPEMNDRRSIEVTLSSLCEIHAEHCMFEIIIKNFEAIHNGESVKSLIESFFPA